MKVLFVCTQNLLRSLTAEALYRGRPDLDVRSAGIAPDARVPVTEELLQWAEIVFVMEERHRQYRYSFSHRHREDFLKLPFVDHSCWKDQRIGNKDFF